MTRSRVVYLLGIILACLTVVQGTPSELYFSNNVDIMRLINGSSSVVIHEVNLVNRIDCNICDRLIYWVDQPGTIARADPRDSSSMETVISSDFSDPRGLAVDWVGNNLYFTHGKGENGRVEVSSCDGTKRRVLIIGIPLVGPIAVNVATGYMYYAANLFEIWRAMLNGSDHQMIYEDYGIDDQYFGEIVGLEVDISSNKLYWTNRLGEGPYAIKELDLNQEPLTARALPTNSFPHELTIHDGVLYWTVEQELNSDHQVTGPGALYSMAIEEEIVLLQETVLLQNETLSPQDLCYFFDSSMPAGDCATNNGGCLSLCLTVPSADGGTQAQCVCPTGIIPSEDGSCPIYPNQFLLITQEHTPAEEDTVSHTDIRIISLDTAPPFIDTLTPITVPMTSANFIAYDITQHHVYWSQQDPPQIRRAELDGTDEQVIIQTSISEPESLAVDPYSKNLYWVDSRLDKIEVVSLETFHRKVLINTGSQPQGLALDLRNRWVYWTDLVSHSPSGCSGDCAATTPSVERCHLDGTGCEAIPLSMEIRQSIREPATIAVDPLTDYVYWAETKGDHIVVYNGRTGEANQEVLFVEGAGHPGDISGLAVHGDYLYWTDRSGNRNVAMGRVTKNNLSGEELVLKTGGLYSVLAANTSAQSIIAECSSCEQLCLPGPSGGTCSCEDHLNREGSACTSPVAYLFLATNEGVYIAQNNPNWMRIPNQMLGSPDININVQRMDVHFKSEMIYWIDAEDKLIYRRPINGTSTRLVHCCVGSTEDLAVDWFGENLYWTDSSRRVIEVAKLDGSQRTVLYTIPSYLDAPELIIVDPFRGHLYWSSLSLARIYRWNMDGSSVMDSSSVVWENNQYERVFGMAVNYTEQPGIYDQIYFGAGDASVASVFTLDLATEAVSFIRDIKSPPGYEVAAFMGDFLYLEGSDPNFKVGSIDPGDPQNVNLALDLFSISFDLISVSDLAILHHSIQPGLHECSVDNNGCGSGAVCLVNNGVSGGCVCSPLEEMIVEKNTQGHSFVNCNPATSFVLIATEDSIYHLPFTDPMSSSHSSLVQPLPLPTAGSIQTMAYDPLTRSVLYTNNDTLLHRVALDSSSATTSPIPSGLQPTSLAFDWKGGHVFITETPGFQIELAVINGDGVGSVLNFEPTDKYYDRLNLLGEVVFNSETGTLYWTYIFTEGLGNELRYMKLSERQEQIIDLGGRNIRGLTVEPTTQSLFWISVLTDGSCQIERYDIEERNIITVHSGSDNRVEGLASLVVDSQPYLLWFDRTRGAIYVHNGTSAQEYRQWSPGAARIVGMLGHTTTPTLISECRDTNRPCSHYCLDTSACACPANSQLGPDGKQCNAVNCGSLLSCGDSLDECYPRTYWCDGIPHCRNGADENCPCNTDTDFACYQSTDCVSMASRCNGVPDCPRGEDELDCLCDGGDAYGYGYGCYVEDDTPDLLGGGSKLYYQCLPNNTRCDHIPDCYDSTIDEPEDCPSPTTDTTSAPNTFTIPATIVCVVLAGGAVVVILVLCVWAGKVIAKKKREDIASNRMSRALNFNLNDYKPRESPQQRVDSVSDYYSDCTNTTQVGNSTASGNSMYKRRSAAGLSTDPSNPPPSPMSGRRSPDCLTDIDDESVYSQPMSEYPVPPPPNPSLNYSMVSDNASYSVSQSQLHATISGRAPNPLLLHQQHRSYGYPYQQGVYQPPLPSNGQQWAQKRDTHYTNGKYTYTSDYHHYPPSHPRKELDSLARTETESTISMTTVDSTENRDEFDDVMSYTNPGRCGRPTTPVSTVVSDYHPPAPPMSPDSTLSEFSGDECSERHLHQT